MTVNNLGDNQDIALYKREIADLHRELENVYNINEDHRILNGELREEIKELQEFIQIVLGDPLKQFKESKLC
jgi:hypothetical protein